jgi:ribosomal protein S18 acetylase RimI-like enzyme
MVRYVHVASDGEEYVFREPAPDEARKYMEFINSFVGEPMSGLLINRRVSLKEEQAWLEARVAEIRSRSGVMLTAERAGRIVGNCSVERLPWKHSHRAMFGIAVALDARGRGVGEALMRKTLELAVRRLKGLESVDLSAFDYNDRALSLYRKVGFREYARIPRSAKEGAKYFDEVLMRVELPLASAEGGQAGRGSRRRE